MRASDYGQNPILTEILISFGVWSLKWFSSQRGDEKKVNRKKLLASPLAVLLLGAVIIGGVVGVLVNYWSHSMEKSDVEYTILGMDAYAIQIVPSVTQFNPETYDSYIAKTVATSFEEINEYFMFYEAMIVALDSTNLDLTGGLVITVSFDNTGEVSASLIDCEYVMFYVDGVGDRTTINVASPPPTIVPSGPNYTITIPLADVHLLTYDDTWNVQLGDPVPGANDANALILEFAFSGSTRDAVDEESWGTFTGSSLVTIELGEDA